MVEKLSNGEGIVKLIVCTMQRHAPNPNSCGNSGGHDIADALERHLADNCLPVPLERVACLGKCPTGPLQGSQGTVVQLYPTGKSWRGITREDVPGIIASIQRHHAKNQ